MRVDDYTAQDLIQRHGFTRAHENAKVYDERVIEFRGNIARTNFSKCGDVL